jgi:hypothetical protein
VVRPAFWTAAERSATPAVLSDVTPYDPPDPTLVEVKPEALDFWSRTLEQPPENIKKAVQKVGPVLETVKKELGIGGGD